VKEMTNITDLGLPDISDETLERLAEECEKQVTDFLLKRVPGKSIEDLSISCSLNLFNGQLDVDIEIDVSQGFVTGVPLDDLAKAATDWGANWLEKQLMELKRT
jgi:hypothetical protein